MDNCIPYLLKFGKCEALQKFKLLYKYTCNICNYEQTKTFTVQPFKCQVSAVVGALFNLKCQLQDNIIRSAQKNIHLMGPWYEYALKVNFLSLQILQDLLFCKI
jgi:hypothetical protein